MTVLLALLAAPLGAWALLSMGQDVAALALRRRGVKARPVVPEREAPPIYEEHAAPLSPLDYGEQQLEREMQGWQHRPAELVHGR